MRMNRFLAIGCLLLSAASQASAQQPGGTRSTDSTRTVSSKTGIPDTVNPPVRYVTDPNPMRQWELGIFGQYTFFDVPENRPWKDAAGGGVRAGYFLTQRWQVEGELSYTRLNFRPFPGSDKRATYVPMALRLNYNAPLGDKVDFMLGAGVARMSYRYTQSVAPMGNAGFRFAFNPYTALRIDGTYAVMPDFTPKWHDVGARIGLSFFTPQKYREQEVRITRTDTVTIRDLVTVTIVAPVIAVAPLDTMVAHVEFDFNRASIKTDQEDILKTRVIPFFQAHPEVKLAISGHTDECGSNSYNQRLAQRRAMAVRDWLKRNGVTNPIAVAPVGTQQLLEQKGKRRAVCKSQLNRRAEFYINITGVEGYPGGGAVVAPKKP
jgi:outer membrane protein OmpA-like peptidoglycan-associated protein